VVLEAVGITSIQELATASRERLAGLEGMNVEQVETLLATARVTMAELDKMIENAVGEQLAQDAETALPLFDEEALEEAAVDQEDDAPAEPTAENVDVPGGPLFKEFPAEDQVEDETEPAVAEDESAAGDSTPETEPDA